MHMNTSEYMHNVSSTIVNYHTAGNFGEIFDLVNSAKVTKLKTHQYRFCTRAYDAKNPDHQI